MQSILERLQLAAADCPSDRLRIDLETLGGLIDGQETVGDAHSSTS